MLKRLVHDMILLYLISSDQLICILSKEFPTVLPFGAMLFSIEAVGMYSNIDTEHGIEIIRKFILGYTIEITKMQILVLSRDTSHGSVLFHIVQSLSGCASSNFLTLAHNDNLYQ